MNKEEFCSVGLLSFAMKGQVDSTTGECGDLLANIIRENYPERVAGGEEASESVIIAFNDHSDTTFADVERVFEKAEVAWDERV